MLSHILHIHSLWKGSLAQLQLQLQPPSCHSNHGPIHILHNLHNHIRHIHILWKGSLAQHQLQLHFSLPLAIVSTAVTITTISTAISSSEVSWLSISFSRSL